MDRNLTKYKFASFFMGGFECTYALKKTGRIDLLSLTKHDEYIEEDYKLLANLGIKTVREGLSWSQIDKKGKYDFFRFEKIMEAGQRHKIEQIWDLNHFDYPDYLDPFTDGFCESFSKYALTALDIIKKYNKNKVYIVPINEISYFSWMGAEVGRWAPFKKKTGWEFKKQLVKASIAAIKNIKEKYKDVLFIQVDPLMYRVPNPCATKEVDLSVHKFNEGLKWQTWDMFMEYPDSIDLIGVNYYYFNQEWVRNVKDTDSGEFLTWGIGWKTPNRKSLANLLQEVYERYKKPILISETGGWGEYRWKWWKRILKETEIALDQNIPIYGICAYPVIDRPDWENGHLTNSGLWDFIKGDRKCARVPHEKTIKIISRYINKRQKNEDLVESFDSM